jgi:hypothetical protein
VERGVDGEERPGSAAYKRVFFMSRDFKGGGGYFAALVLGFAKIASISGALVRELIYM